MSTSCERWVKFLSERSLDVKVGIFGCLLKVQLGYFGMDTAKSDSISQPSTQFCNCYKVANLGETILETTGVSKLKDKYILGEQLGWGQFGVIRACSDKFTGEVLACKSIAKDRLVTVDDMHSVKLEIEIMTRLSTHPNVVNLKAVYEEENYVHLLMELCAGGELFHQLEKQGRFSEYNARIIFKHLMEVVKFCHENGQKLHGTVGSPFYIAPEVLSGGYNQAADVWSAGVILYILLSGMPPFWGKTKSRIFDAVRAADLRFPPDPWDRISSSAKDLITGMLCVDPSKRLTAEQVLEHYWMEDYTKAAEEAYNQHYQVCNELEVGSGSFSTPFIARTEDFAIDGGPGTVGDGKLKQSPVFTCRSSFASFRVDDNTPCSASGGFSFSSCHKSSAAEFSSPISSMPSFTFFSPMSTLVQGNISLRFKADESLLDVTYTESNMEKLILQPNFLPVKRDAGELERKEIRRGPGGTKVAGIHSKRNHTIGLGEFTQLNLIVTESVIRWASCTDIPTAPSLRLSLVC
ncbi:Tyrosine-protein kinase [Parasponia andersonii]|uniref:Tyrosine-protein kinase n=1 Tax=Parasponia andersonii TaxID=3476 RepID=A0A2P5C929_PARAD|nr:Tyrosine-protein kinase [Parasponia andersonii]